MYERILVPVDDSPPAREAARHARAIAGWTGASVTLLHVVRVENPLSFGVSEVAALNEAEAFLEDLIAELFDERDDVRSLVRRGVPHEEITGFADGEGVDLVVMGRRGADGLREHMLGSTSTRVLRSTRVPTLLVPAGERDDG